MATYRIRRNDIVSFLFFVLVVAIGYRMGMTMFNP